MERLSHDLNLALEESAGAGASAGSGGCGGGERRKLGLRRRTRSAGNLPAACSAPLEEGSSSSPGHGAAGGGGAASQPLSDSDEGAPARVPLYCPPGRSVESDSFNENLSPTRPPNARRKRKYKKMAIDYAPPADALAVQPLIAQTNSLSPAVFAQSQGLSPVSQITKKKRIVKSERGNVYCGKRKWSVRERGEGAGGAGAGEMRERSFSGGCSSKSYFFTKNYDFKSGKKYALDKAPKPKVLSPSKISVAPLDRGDAPDVAPDAAPRLAAAPALPGSSSFNFVYKNPLLKNGTPCFKKITGFKITTELPPVFDPGAPTPATQHKHRRSKPHGKSGELRELGAGDMECSGVDLLSSSSLSSSDSDGVVTCDSDREGDDELTDWPGSDEITIFNRTLNLKTSKGAAPAPKPIKKEKFLPKYGLSSCKNKYDRGKADALAMDDEAMMSDSATLGADDAPGSATFTSFGDVKNAGLLGRGADEAFFHAFQTHCADAPPSFGDTPRSNFALQKTSSSDLNLSEKSPQSDPPCCGGACGEIREIRAGCRRIRDERPGLVILSAANERLARFLQDSCRAELRLPTYGAHEDPAERDKLRSLAKLYSLELHLELGRAVLKKTRNTTQAIRVEGVRAPHAHAFSEYKRRCYGDDEAGTSPPSPPPPPPLAYASCLDSLLDHDLE